MTIFDSNAHSQVHVHIYVCIFIWQSTCSYKSMCITYCIVTCSCISINTHHKYIACTIYVICTCEDAFVHDSTLHFCAHNKHAAHNQWWSKLSQPLELQLFFHFTESAHVSMLLHYLDCCQCCTLDNIVQCVSFMLDNTQRPKRLLQCVHSTQQWNTLYKRVPYKHKTDTVLIYIQWTSQNDHS